MRKLINPPPTFTNMLTCLESVRQLNGGDSSGRNILEPTLPGILQLVV